MASWPSGISAITLFVEDLATTKQFYLDTFDLAVHYEDDVSCVFNFGEHACQPAAGHRGARADRAGHGRSAERRRADAVHDRCR